MQGFLVMLLIMGIVVAIVIACIQAVKKRREDLQTIARQMSMDFFPDGDEGIAPMLSNLEFFRYGDRCKVSNLIRGQIDRKGRTISVAIFDYDYTICLHQSTEFSLSDNSISVEIDNNTQSFCQTVLVFYDESLDLPGFGLRPEHLWDKLANLVGFEDINFDGFPNFSQQYRLSANPDADIHQIFQPNLIKFYESNQICSEAIGPYVLIFPFDAGNGHRSSNVVGNKTFTTSR
jgi:hypothetical protein